MEKSKEKRRGYEKETFKLVKNDGAVIFRKTGTGQRYKKNKKGKSRDTEKEIQKRQSERGREREIKYELINKNYAQCTCMLFSVVDAGL